MGKKHGVNPTQSDALRAHESERVNFAFASKAARCDQEARIRTNFLLGNEALSTVLKYTANKSQTSVKPQI
jgi:hypothetical protein